MIESERLFFVHYLPGDFLDYFRLVSNPQVMKRITGRPLLKSEARKRLGEMLEINEKYPDIGHFKILNKTDNSFMGQSKLEMTEDNEAEIGYALLPYFWGKGFGNEAAKAMVDLARKVFEISCLIAIIDPGNTASKRILEKQGFYREGVGHYLGLPAVYFRKGLCH